MRTLLAVGAVIACAVVAAVLFVGTNGGVVPLDAKPAAITSSDSPSPLIVHEWGTFTSFSGSNGVPVGFTPNNEDLPEFVYHQPGGKGARLIRDGIVSMETPVIYFYAGKKTSATVKVDFPSGWITEWYPFAVTPPQHNLSDKYQKLAGQSIQWKVDLLADESLQFPRRNDKNPYFHAARPMPSRFKQKSPIPVCLTMPCITAGLLCNERSFFSIVASAISHCRSAFALPPTEKSSLRTCVPAPCPDWWW